MNNTKVGTFIKEQLKLNNITQEVLAEKLGISCSAVSQGLSGKNSFDISNLMEIAKILDVDLDLIVNAGKERETNLERLAKMTKDKFVKEDPDFKSLRDSDSKDKKIIHYIIKHKNIELIKYLQDKGINRLAKGNANYLALLIEFGELEILKKSVNQENKLPNFYSIEKRGARKTTLKGYVKSGHISEYDFLDDNQKAVVDSVINTSNKDMLEYLPYFQDGIDKKNIPVMIYFAIQFDKIEILKYEDGKHKPYDSQLKALLQRKYEELFVYAITHKSRKCLEHLYAKISVVKYEKLFKYLTETNDIEFSKWFIDIFPEKTNDRFHSNHEKGINNSKSLIQLINQNDIDMLKFSVLFSNQESLDIALSNTKEEQVGLMKILIKSGAKFTYRDGYSGEPVQMEQVTAVMRNLLEKIDK
jgi:transcriptional regulator with XRE-family HTH domain